MRPQTAFDNSTNNNLKTLLSKTKKKSDFQRVQCVWLRVEFGMDASTVAGITNLSTGTVRKIWSNFIKEGEKCLIGKKRGGRRNYHLTIKEERLFLAPFFKKAEDDNVLMVTEVKAAFEKKIGGKIPKSTIYRILARHGWKKAPFRILPSEDRNREKEVFGEILIDSNTPPINPDFTDNYQTTFLIT